MSVAGVSCARIGANIVDMATRWSSGASGAEGCESDITSVSSGDLNGGLERVEPAAVTGVGPW